MSKLKGWQAFVHDHSGYEIAEQLAIFDSRVRSIIVQRDRLAEALRAIREEAHLHTGYQWVDQMVAKVLGEGT